MREFQNWLMIRLVPSFKLKIKYLYLLCFKDEFTIDNFFDNCEASNTLALTGLNFIVYLYLKEMESGEEAEDLFIGHKLLLIPSNW